MELVKITSLVLKASACNWLRYQRQCPIISLERGIGSYIQKPDIFAVAQDRKSIEIEVKVDWSDFVNDRQKRKWRFEGEQYTWCHWPWQFYYLIPPAMCKEASQYLEKNDSLWKQSPGLLTLSDGYRNDWNQNIEMIVVQRIPGINKLSEKLTIKQISELVKHQSGTICSLLAKLVVQTNQQSG